MNARELWFTAPGHVEIRERVLPEPSSDETLILTELCGISAGTERLVWQGRFPEGIVLDEGIPALNRPSGYPCPFGYNLVGKIPGSSGLHLAFHPHCDAAVVRKDSLITLPPHWPGELAVLLPNAETAFNLILDAAARAGERIIVFGLGIVGLLVTAMLARFPLESLTAVDPDPGRRNRAGTLAGVTVLSPDEASAVYADGADLIFELSGSPRALQGAVDNAGYAARIVVGSWYGTKPVTLDLGSSFHRKRLDIISSQVSTIAPELRGRWNHRRRMNFAIRWLEDIGNPDWVTHRFPLENAADAYNLIEENNEDWLQVVLKP
jgi:2-desacetyl-2-hydroxyethyl bacteriochlorophyllide A dehydrogenase